MAILEGFRVRNYGVLKDVTLGRLWDQGKVPLTPITAIIGKNGVGKTTLFDAFGFLAHAFKFDVETACDDRGGLKKYVRKERKSQLFLMCTTENIRMFNLLHTK